MTITELQSWAYKGTTVAGKAVGGRLDARTEAAVANRLRGMGIAPSAIERAPAGTGLNREITLKIFEKKTRLSDLAVMSRQLSTMISSGLTLLRALTIVAEQTESHQLRMTLAVVRTDVETGMSLSEALAKHPGDFPPLLLNLIRAGETGGFLERSLESVAQNYEAEVKLRSTVKAALTYPVVVLVIAIVAVIGMLVFIVPVFQGMFEDFDGELPLPTRILVTFSQIMIWLAPVLVVAGVVFAVWWGKNKNTERVRRVVDPWLLRLPVFGPLLAKIAIARFSRNFATMIGAGVPILSSLGIVGSTSGNYVVER
ncbi:MAG: type secretion system family protein, partial [Glaciihabitans sp.]|nr:type secretion system family protein [Glaciihabitans sp.]